MAGDSWAHWLRISSHEGGAAYWVAMIALLAALAALILGISISRGWLLSTPNFLSALATTVGLMAAMTLIATGFIWLASDLPPKVDGRPVEVEAELRLPPGMTLESVQNANGYATITRISAGDSIGIGNFDFKAAQTVEGQIVLPVSVPLSTSASKKMLSIVLADGPAMYFPMNPGSKPARQDFEWTQWLTPADGPGSPPSGPALAYALRYRLYVVPLPPPPLTSEQQQAQNETQKQAELLALAPDAPLAQWLVFTRYGTPQPQIDAAIMAIRARPNYVVEMAHEMLDGENEASSDALRAIEHVKPPPVELAEAVAAVGRAIAQMLRDLEKEPPGTPKYDALIGDISTRFSAWMVATRALQIPNVADFTPQLQEILEPARKLNQLHSIRIDVVRVASFYLHEWAGIAPLPTDPPPT
jgi:hypothetical protein